MSIDNKKKVTRPGSGRTKGSYSFVLVSVNDIGNVLKDHDSKIVKLSRKQAEQLGIQAQSMRVGDLGGKIEGTMPNTQVEMKVRTFDED